MVCFPGGAGGHFIANLCSLLLFGRIFSNVKPDGSMHGGGINFIQHPKSLEGRSLDRSIESYKQELEVIESLKDFEIAIGHFRYLNKLVAINKKVIYISFENDDKRKINYNVRKKTNIFSISEQHYNAIKGSDWPNYSEYLLGNISDEFIDFRQNKDLLEDWFYEFPQNFENVCEIKFKEIGAGNELLTKLCKFLNTTSNIEFASNLIKQYREKNV